MENKFEMVAKTFQGLEDVLRDELIALGAENVEMGCRMVTFEGDKELMYKANLCCRTALRILKPIVKFNASDPDELYDKVRELAWEDFMDVTSSFSVDSTVNSADFSNSRFVVYRVKDGIVDHFYDLCRRRPNVELDKADIQLNVHIADSRVTISLDSSGEPLYQRGYKVAQTKAPINEVLAAGIIMKSGWRGDSDFVDPMCGSGTFLIEAALIAANINPGIYRKSFGFETWKDFDPELFERLYDDDSQEREFEYKIMGGDNDGDAVLITRRNIKSAGLEKMISVEVKRFQDWTDLPEEGILVTNPPYGERLRPEALDTLYKEIGSTLKKNFAGWHAWFIGYRDDQFAQIGLKPSVKYPVFNGALECQVREYVMFNGNYSEFRADGGSVHNDTFQHDRAPKIRHQGEKEWKEEARKFNRKAGRHEDLEGARPKKRTRMEGKDRDGKKPFRKDGDRPFRKDGDRPFRKDGDRPFRKDGDRPFRKDGDRPFRKDGDRPFRKDGDRKPFRKEGDGRKPFRKEGPKTSSYVPNSGAQPTIPADKGTVFFKFPIRHRKKRDEEGPAENPSADNNE